MAQPGENIDDCSTGYQKTQMLQLILYTTPSEAESSNYQSVEKVNCPFCYSIRVNV